MTCRELHLSDYPRIQDITSDVFSGNDYVASSFQEWMTNPRCKAFGLELDGQLIGFMNMRLIDGGLTMWMEGTRFHRDFRNKGHNHALQMHCWKYMFLETNVRRIRGTVSSKNGPSLHSCRKAMAEIFQMKFYRTHLAVQAEGHVQQEISKLLPSGCPPNPRPISASHLVHVLTSMNPPLREGLFPMGFVVLDWKVCDVMADNVPIFNKWTGFAVWDEATRVVSSFSLGNVASYSKFGKVWVTSIYTQDRGSILKHLEKQLEMARLNGCPVLDVVILPVFSNFFKEVGWEAIRDPDHDDISVTIFETDVEKKKQELGMAKL